MKAWIVERWCEPEQMRWGECPTPEPGPGQVRIRIKASAVNFFDILQIQGKYQVRPPFPFSPGGEVAGLVDAVGEGSNFRPGQRVMAMTQTGGYAEQALARDESVYAISEAMAFEHAAAFPIAYQTAYFGVARRGELKEGQWLLVHAGAGGVGSAAVQIGKALGARVIATAGSAEKVQVCRDLGADHALSYQEEGWHERVKELTGGRGADVIYDPVGGQAFDLSTKCIAWEGRLVVVGFASGEIPHVAANRILLKNISIVGLHFGEYRKHNPQLIVESMKRLLELYERGQVRPLVSKKYPLDRAARAMRELAGRKSTGKLILEV